MKSIKLKIIAIVVICNIILGGVLGGITLFHFTRSLSLARQNQLESIREGTSAHIQNYMKWMESLLTSMASDISVHLALKECREGFYKIAQEVKANENEITRQLLEHYDEHYLSKVEYEVPNAPPKKETVDYLPHSLNGKIAQYLYIVKNPHPVGKKDRMVAPEEAFSYARAHEKYHSMINLYLQKFRLYDIFLVDLQGTVVYTDFKEKDYATNLIKGPYQETGLAKVFFKSLELGEGEMAFEDFAPYEPSYHLPAAFIATPIFFEGARQGALVIQLPIDEINKIMTFSGEYRLAGLGETGEVYLVGEDFRMKNDSRFIPEMEESLIQKMKTTIGLLEVRTLPVHRAFKGESAVGSSLNYRKREVLSAFRLVRIFDRQWALVAEISSREAFAEIDLVTRNIVLLSLFLISIMTALSLWMINRGITTPLVLVALKMKELSENERDLTRQIPVTSEDELGRLAGYLNHFLDVLKLQMTQIKGISVILNDSIQETSSSSKEISTTSTQQAAAVKEIVSTMEDANELARHVATQINRVATTANETRQNVENGFSLVQKSQNQMNEIKESNYHTIKEVKGLEVKIESIWEILDIINTIADQTKIIAFNAELEASAAGEAGKNFEIVAGEIRRLADNIVVSTQEIKNYIHEIQDASNNLLLTSQKGTESIQQGWELSRDITGLFEKILSSANESAGSAEQIARSTDQQSSSFDQIILTLKQISEGIGNFVLSTKSMSKLTEGLHQIAKELGEMVSRYRL